MGVFFILSVFDNSFAMFLEIPTSDSRGPQFEKHWHREMMKKLTLITAVS
jgi:hypothetical protein